MDAKSIINFDDIVGASLVSIDDDVIQDTNFLTLTCVKDGDIYKIAVPNVFVRVFKKEELSNGESGARHTGVSETTGEEKDEVDVGEEDSPGDTSEDQGTETE